MVRILDESSFTVSKWSGGKTKELFIFPENADYKLKNFDFRISSAEVEDESSIFTSLPGIHRIIVPLTDSMQLQHEGQKEIVMLNPYQVYAFSGGVETKCVGAGTDFNLMTRNCKGFVEILEPDVKQKETVPFTGKHMYLYSCFSNIQCYFENQLYDVAKGYLVCINEEKEGSLMTISSQETTKIIVVKIL